MTLDAVFLGTAPFGFPVLRTLHGDDQINLKGVFTQPDRARGRGQEPQSPPIATLVSDLGLPLYQPEDINEKGLSQLEELKPIDFAVVIAYGQILSESILTLPEEGCFNFHASLLPRWRGAAPIRHTLLEGDEKTGITIIQLVQELDAGPLCEQLATEVRPSETYGQLYERLSRINVGALRILKSDLASGNLCPRPQKGKITHAPKIQNSDAKINWNQCVEDVRNHLLAFTPDPGSYTFLKDQRLKLFNPEVATTMRAESPPGEVTRIRKEYIQVATRNGELRVKEIQPSGTRRMEVESYLAGDPDLEVGDQLQHKKKT